MIIYSDLWKYFEMSCIQWEFQDPKMEVSLVPYFWPYVAVNGNILPCGYLKNVQMMIENHHCHSYRILPSGYGSYGYLMMVYLFKIFTMMAG